MIVATAGHVDHGKTRLVQALSGVDTDTLAEEKRRGLSIDLGFAYLPLTNAQSIGFIDVPGHERFMRNALCGLAAADFVLLLVAADDGPMPQTREHLAIIDLLGFKRGAIVLSKADRVDSKRVEAVSRELDAVLKATSLRHWPRFTLSAESGAGLELLRDHLLQQAAQTAAGESDELRAAGLRMPVDRCFEIRGAGLVVTGTVVAGSLRCGDTVAIAGTELRPRVRGLRVHDSEQERALPGERCALNLVGGSLRKQQIRRGDWVVSSAVAPPVARFDASLAVIPDSPRPLRHWSPVHLHLGAAELSARVALLQGEAIAPGQSGLVQLVCERPTGAAFGDAFIIRDQSARHTLGGGRVLDIFPPRRGRARPRRIEWLRHSAGSEAGQVLQRLLDSSPGGVDLQHFALNRNLGPEQRSAVDNATGMVVLIVDGRRTGFAQSLVDRYRESILELLANEQRNNADGSAMGRGQLRARLPDGITPALLQALLDDLQAQSRIRAGADGYTLANAGAALSPADSRNWKLIEAALSSNGLRPMTLGELAAQCELPAPQLKPLLGRASQAGLLIRLSQTLVLLPSTLVELHGLIEQLQARAGERGFSVAEFRDACGIGRNRCIEILESLDARGVTRRSGQQRHALALADGVLGQWRRP